MYVQLFWNITEFKLISMLFWRASNSIISKTFRIGLYNIENHFSNNELKPIFWCVNRKNWCRNNEGILFFSKIVLYYCNIENRVSTKYSTQWSHIVILKTKLDLLHRKILLSNPQIMPSICTSVWIWSREPLYSRNG